MDALAKVCPKCGRRFDAGAAFCQTDGVRLQLMEERPDPYIGQNLLDQFKIEEKIGAGGMGSVYRARQTTLHRDVAIKILHPELADNRDAVRRFKREARVCTALDHPNVVRVFLFGQLPDGSLYIVMEHLRGRPLLDVIRAEGALPVHRSLHIATQICDGVGEAHAQGVVHRDLKPENVVLVPKSRDADFVKVLDFGIARVLWGDEVTQATQSGLVFGTARYISPEGAAGEATDARSDVYSLGVLTYQLLSGETPFDAPSPVAMLMKHIHTEAPHLRSLARGKQVPEPVADVVMRALSKNPEGRYDDAHAFGDALRTAAERAGFEVTGQRAHVPSIGPPSEPGSRRAPKEAPRRKRREPRRAEAPRREASRREREPEYREPEYREPEYREPEHREPEYREPEYREPEYREPEYREPEYREPARSKRRYDGEDDTPRVPESGTLQGAPSPFGGGEDVSIAGLPVGARRSGRGGAGRTILIAFAVGVALVAGGFGVVTLMEEEDTPRVDVEGLAQQARDALGTGHYDAPEGANVLALTDRILAARPEHAEANRLRAEVARRLVRLASQQAAEGDRDDARATYQRAQRFSPDDDSIRAAVAALDEPAPELPAPGVRTEPAYVIEDTEVRLVAVLEPGLDLGTREQPRFVVHRGSRSLGGSIAATRDEDTGTYSAQHTFRTPGTYTLRFRLGRGGDRIERRAELEVHRDGSRPRPRPEEDPPPVTTQGSMWSPPAIAPAWNQTPPVTPTQIPTAANPPPFEPAPPPFEPPPPPAPWTGGQVL